ncbi:MAG TPA: hypothetical protein VFX59_04565 [Polyangiales bacterium]|nr:hypothetical protein [Polyangiales bacterium]
MNDTVETMSLEELEHVQGGADQLTADGRTLALLAAAVRQSITSVGESYRKLSS